MRSEKINQPMMYINVKTKEFLVAQSRNTSPYVVSNQWALGKLCDLGFEPFCRIAGDASILLDKEFGWKQIVPLGYKPQIENTKADALAYAEAVVLILKREAEKDI